MLIKFSMKKVMLNHGVMLACWENLILYSFIRMVFLRLKFRLLMGGMGLVMNYLQVLILNKGKVVLFSYCQLRKELL